MTSLEGDVRSAQKQVGSLATGGVVRGDTHFHVGKGSNLGCSVPWEPFPPIININPTYNPDWIKELGLDFPVTEEKVPGKQEQFALDLDTVLDGIRSLLIEKNRKYGDSALTPSRTFSSSDAVEQIKVRIDDKLTRLKNQQGDEDEDVAKDLLGYLIILQIAELRASEQV